MRWNMFYFLLLASCFLAPAFADSSKAHQDSIKYERGEVKTGTINAVSIEDRQIIIDNKAVEIADDIQLTAKNEKVLNLLSLAPGQQIQYWSHPQDKVSATNAPPLPSSIATKIHIITGLNENAYKR